jgi:hypothetical protein
MADDPTGGFKIPMICQANESVIGCDIRKEGELPATDRAKFSLAMIRTLASQQAHMFGSIFEQLLRVYWIGRAFVTLPQVPQAGLGLQVFPFLMINHRYRLADITTKRFPGRVVNCTQTTAIQRCDRFVESVIDFTDFALRKLHFRIVSGFSLFCFSNEEKSQVSMNSVDASGGRNLSSETIEKVYICANFSQEANNRVAFA